MTQACRFVFYEDGLITACPLPGQTPSTSPSWPARIRKITADTYVVSALIDGFEWNGRIFPNPKNQIKGQVILYQAAAKGSQNA